MPNLNSNTSPAWTKKLDVNRTFVTPKVSEGASGAAKAVDSEVTASHQGRLGNVLTQQT